jgi:hypothetical protein
VDLTLQEVHIMVSLQVTLSRVLIIMFIYLLIGIVYTCDYQSMYANITDTNALIPINTIE